LAFSKAKAPKKGKALNAENRQMRKSVKYGKKLIRQKGSKELKIVKKRKSFLEKRGKNLRERGDLGLLTSLRPLL
jgi:hypothetical protein